MLHCKHQKPIRFREQIPNLLWRVSGFSDQGLVYYCMTNYNLGKLVRNTHHCVQNPNKEAVIQKSSSHTPYAALLAKPLLRCWRAASKTPCKSSELRVTFTKWTQHIFGNKLHGHQDPPSELPTWLTSPILWHKGSTLPNCNSRSYSSYDSWNIFSSIWFLKPTELH